MNSTNLNTMNSENKKNKTKETIIRRILIVFFIGIGAWFVMTLPGGSLLKTGTVAPEWTLKLADGTKENLNLSDLKGKVVVLDFWSIHCPPCIQEIRVLKTIWRKMQNKDVVIVGISTGGESLKKIETFAKQKNINYPLAVDSKGVASEHYMVKSLPTLYVIDTNGKISMAHSGYLSEDDLLEAIDAAMEAK